MELIQRQLSDTMEKSFGAKPGQQNLARPLLAREVSHQNHQRQACAANASVAALRLVAKGSALWRLFEASQSKSILEGRMADDVCWTNCSRTDPATLLPKDNASAIAFRLETAATL